MRRSSSSTFGSSETGPESRVSSVPARGPCPCPVSLPLPLAVRPPVHQGTNPQLPHVAQRMLVGHITSTRPDIPDDFERQVFVIDNDSLHHLGDDAEISQSMIHLLVGPDRAAVQEPCARSHVRHDAEAMKVERQFSTPACQFGSLARSRRNPWREARCRSQPVH